MRLFNHFIVHRLLQERARTLTTVLGVALGVAVVIAIQLTNTSSVKGFETALSTVAGKASIEILGNGGVDETTLPSLGWLREFGAASPVIEGEMALVLGGELRARRTEALKVLGVDILRDLTIREYVVGAAEALNQEARGRTEDLSAQQFLELLTSPQSVVLTEKLARQRGLSLGDSVRLMAGDRVNTYTIRGLLEDDGPARVMDGNFVLMDIAAAQLAFDRLGRVDRVDVMLHDASSNDAIDRSLSAIAARLPAGLSAQRPARRGQQVERMLAAFHLNLSALSWIALVVGLFLVYNTVTISVIARREEIGTLRALGTTRRQILWLFLGEAAALGLAGTIVGLAIGRLLADLSGRDHERDRQHALHRIGGGHTVAHTRTRGAGVCDRLPAVACGRLDAGARSEPGDAHGGNPRLGPRRVPAQSRAACPRRPDGRAVGCRRPRHAWSSRRQAALRLRLVIRDGDWRVAVRACDHLRARAAVARPVASPARC